MIIWQGDFRRSSGAQHIEQQNAGCRTQDYKCWVMWTQHRLHCRLFSINPFCPSVFRTLLVSRHVFILFLCVCSWFPLCVYGPAPGLCLAGWTVPGVQIFVCKTLMNLHYMCNVMGWMASTHSMSVVVRTWSSWSWPHCGCGLVQHV